MLAESRATRFCAQGVVWALLLLACARPLAQTGAANTPAASTTYFAIEESSLSAALITFSRQSGTPIVFSDRLTRHLQAPAIAGNLDPTAALNRLLEDTELAWEFIDQRIIAVYARHCDDSSCASPEETSTRFPVYQPGIEETYVYGSHLTGSRIRRDPGRYSAPVDVYARSDIERSGAQTIGELLKFVPAV
ncbi:MAG TPA: STN domain-containing protein, partial [Kineobactrum sp.]